LSRAWLIDPGRISQRLRIADKKAKRSLANNAKQIIYLGDRIGY